MGARELMAAAALITCLGGCSALGGDPGPDASTGQDPASPTPTEGWDTVFDRLGGSVLRLSVSGCDEAWSGSGFLVDEDVVVTAAHVAEGAQTISVQAPGGETREAQVLGVVPENDVAVLRLDGELGEEPLTLARTTPPRGAGLAVLGYPLGTYELRIAQGIVTGLPEPVDYEDQHVDQAFFTDAAVNRGNSGGPVIGTTGEVIGLVSGVTRWEADAFPVEGTNHVIPVEDVRRNLDALRDHPEVVLECPSDVEVEDPDFGDYSDTEGEDGGENEDSIDLSVQEGSDLADSVALVLYTHGTAINEGRYGSAFEFFTPRQQRSLGGLEAWGEGLENSYWLGLDVLGVEPDEEGAVATVALRTLDLGEESDTCTLWRLEYRMVVSDDSWLIDRAEGKRADCTD